MNSANIMSALLQGDVFIHTDFGWKIWLDPECGELMVQGKGKDSETTIISVLFEHPSHWGREVSVTVEKLRKVFLPKMKEMGTDTSLNKEALFWKAIEELKV